jgi:hypothetical protein
MNVIIVNIVRLKKNGITIVIAQIVYCRKVKTEGYLIARSVAKSFAERILILCNKKREKAVYI